MKYLNSWHKICYKMNKVIKMIPILLEIIPFLLEIIPILLEMIPILLEMIPIILEFSTFWNWLKSHSKIFGIFPTFLEIIPILLEMIPNFLEFFQLFWKWFKSNSQIFGIFPTFLEMIPILLEMIPNILEFFQLFWKWFQFFWNFSTLYGNNSNPIPTYLDFQVFWKLFQFYWKWIQIFWNFSNFFGNYSKYFGNNFKYFGNNSKYFGNDVIQNDVKWHELTWFDMNWHEWTWCDMNDNELIWNEFECSNFFGFQNDRKGMMPTTMINEVNTMTTRQNDLVVKNCQTKYSISRFFLKSVSREKQFFHCMRIFNFYFDGKFVKPNSIQQKISDFTREKASISMQLQLLLFCIERKYVCQTKFNINCSIYDFTRKYEGIHNYKRVTVFDI